MVFKRKNQRGDIFCLNNQPLSPINPQSEWKKMTLIRSSVKHAGEIKQNVSNYHKCPVCGESFEIGIESDVLQKLNEDQYFPYPHLHLHGNPLHAMLCYIDKDLKVRTVGKIKSIEISRDSETFSQIMRKWSNPF